MRQLSQFSKQSWFTDGIWEFSPVSMWQNTQWRHPISTWTWIQRAANYTSDEFYEVHPSRKSLMAAELIPLIKWPLRRVTSHVEILSGYRHTSLQLAQGDIPNKINNDHNLSAAEITDWCAELIQLWSCNLLMRRCTSKELYMRFETIFEN